MTAEVNNVLAQLAIIQREIMNPLTGTPIVAYDNVPYVINSADMPLFVNLAGPLQSNQFSGADEQAREFNEIRNFKMNLYYAAYGTGVEGEKFGLLTPFFPLVYGKFGSYPHLKQLAGTLDARLINDTGMTTLDFSGHKWFAVSFTLQVISKVRRLLDELE